MPRVVHYEAEFVENHSPPRMPFSEFVNLYRDLEWECRQFGRVNESGEYAPQFYLMWADRFGLEHRYLYLEICDKTVFTEEWLDAVTVVLNRHPGWGIGIMNFNEGYALVFADRLMVTGQPFADCQTVGEVATAGRGQLRK
jgi:hypothetical protein